MILFFVLLMGCEVPKNEQKWFYPNVFRNTDAAISISYALTMNKKVF